jgi:hypothetical protein
MWRTLGAFTVRGGPADEGQVKARVARIARRLDVPVGFLEQIEAAVTRATMSAPSPEGVASAQRQVEVQVLISEPWLGTETRARLRPASPKAAGQPQQPGHEPASQGWGFFLVEQPASEPPAGRTQAHHRVELYLYPEGSLEAGET